MRPITDLIIEARKKSGIVYKRYPSGWKYNQAFERLKQGGIYVFWWIVRDAGSLKPFFEETCERKYTLQGKKVVGTTESPTYQTIEVEITDEWLTSYSKI